MKEREEKKEKNDSYMQLHALRAVVYSTRVRSPIRGKSINNNNPTSMSLTCAMMGATQRESLEQWQTSPQLEGTADHPYWSFNFHLKQGIILYLMF